jgi:AcrR family transcriptional regulator
MPRLAQHLDVGVTSIYWYFKSKEELLDALTAEAFHRFYGRMPQIEGRKWDDVLREFFTNFRSILREDEVLCDLCIMRTGHYTDDTIQITWSRIEEILEVLVAAGFSDESATHAYFSLSVYTRGSLFIERSLRAGGINPGAALNPRVQLAAAMPVMSHEVARYNWYMVSDDDFHFGLETILSGLRTLLAADRKAARSTAKKNGAA